jgi:hypothetical protein
MSGFAPKSVNLRMSYRLRGITLVVTDPLCGAGEDWRATVIVGAAASVITACTDRARVSPAARIALIGPKNWVDSG